MVKKINLRLWAVVQRYVKSGPFHVGSWEGSLAVYNLRKEAERVCKELRRQLGRGNCYVQSYGPSK